MRLVERLIAFRIFVPAYIESRKSLLGTLIRVRVCRVKFSAGVNFISSPSFASCVIFQPPAGRRVPGRASEIAIRIFQMLVAQQNFGPFAAILFEDGRPRHKNRRNSSRLPPTAARRRDPIDDQQLLAPVQRKIPSRQNFRLLAQRLLPQPPAPHPLHRRVRRPPSPQRPPAAVPSGIPTTIAP